MVQPPPAGDGLRVATEFAVPEDVVCTWTVLNVSFICSGFQRNEATGNRSCAGLRYLEQEEQHACTSGCAYQVGEQASAVATSCVASTNGICSVAPAPTMASQGEVAVRSEDRAVEAFRPRHDGPRVALHLRQRCTCDKYHNLECFSADLRFTSQQNTKGELARDPALLWHSSRLLLPQRLTRW